MVSCCGILIISGQLSFTTLSKNNAYKITKGNEVMSTRAQVIVKDKYTSLLFYRHSDGYEEGTMPSLEKFLDLVKSGAIRDNTSQAAGWLILIGRDEYDLHGFLPDAKDNFSGWKVGAYEPTNCIHGNIEYLYVIDLQKKIITVHTEDFERVLETEGRLK